MIEAIAAICPWGEAERVIEGGKGGRRASSQWGDAEGYEVVWRIDDEQ